MVQDPKLKPRAVKLLRVLPTPLSLHSPMKMLPFKMSPHRQFLSGLGVVFHDGRSSQRTGLIVSEFESTLFSFKTIYPLVIYPLLLLQVPSTAKAILGKVMKKILLVIISKHMKHILIMSSQHGFLKGKSCIIKLITFYNEMTGSVDAGRAVDIVYLDFSKGFSAVFCNVLTEKLIK